MGGGLGAGNSFSFDAYSEIEKTSRHSNSDHVVFSPKQPRATTSHRVNFEEGGQGVYLERIRRCSLLLQFGLQV